MANIEDGLPIVKYDGLNSAKDGTLSGNLAFSGTNTHSGSETLSLKTTSGAVTMSGGITNTGGFTENAEVVTATNGITMTVT